MGNAPSHPGRNAGSLVSAMIGINNLYRSYRAGNIDRHEVFDLSPLSPVKRQSWVSPQSQDKP